MSYMTLGLNNHQYFEVYDTITVLRIWGENVGNSWGPCLKRRERSNSLASAPNKLNGNNNHEDKTTLLNLIVAITKNIVTITE